LCFVSPFCDSGYSLLVCIITRLNAILSSSDMSSHACTKSLKQRLWLVTSVVGSFRVWCRFWSWVQANCLGGTTWRGILCNRKIGIGTYQVKQNSGWAWLVRLMW
jgi:hypothetical protein